MLPILLAAGVLAAGCTAADQGAGADTISVSGSVMLIDSDNLLWHNGRPCRGTGGYSDIGPGADVTILDNEGKIVGIGDLDMGITVDLLRCRFNFEVSDVPSGLDIYQIEVSHRGKLSYKEDELNETLNVTLGSARG